MVKFPKEGCCKSIDKDLIEYLKKGNSKYNKLDEFLLNKFRPIGIAWNTAGAWYIYGNSSKPLYEIEQLLKIIKSQNKIIEVW